MARMTIASGVALGALLASVPSVSVAAPGGAPIAADVHSALEGEGSVRVWIHLKSRADLSPGESLLGKAERGRFVYETLSTHARDAQGPLLRLLEEADANPHPFWITNAIVADVDQALLGRIAARPEVSRISANPEMYMLHETQVDEEAMDATAGIEWNVEEVGAPELWAQGIRGQGVVVAGADTGVEWDHPALINAYRGNDGLRIDHDYSWFDGVDGVDTPVDGNGHGTFTVGQMVGEDGVNQIGVAPDAQWIGCRNMNNAGFGTPESYTACFEFFIAPTDTRGRNPMPELAPDVVNNSWGCPTVEGCDGDTLLDIVEATQAAGVMLVVSAGNSGASCRSVSDPPATYNAVFTVGAYDQSGNLAGFSSRGPSTFDGSVKPNIAAPGVGIRSAWPGGGYLNGLSGTSMSAPEVAAAAALLWSADPSLIGDIQGTRALLEDSSDPVRGLRCGGSRIEGNNLWGRGMMNIPQAASLLD